MYEQIAAQLQQSGTQLVAVSKTKSLEMIQDMYAKGQLIFGENKVQELVDKHEHLPKDIQWHFIGHLQRNKVKYIAPFISLIHSIDSERLLVEINKQAEKNERIIDCLLQFHIAEEQTKFGLEMEEAHQLLTSETYRSLKNIRIVGVMGMGTFTDDEVQVRAEFQRLKNIFDFLKDKYFAQAPYFKEISMGMSGDYEIAIEEGSTMVRIGTLLFGARNY